MNHGANDDPRYTIRGGKGTRAGLGLNGESRPALPANTISANQILTMQHSSGVVSKGNDNSWDHRDYDRLERSEAMRSQRGLAMNHSTATAVLGQISATVPRERAETQELIGGFHKHKESQSQYWRRTTSTITIRKEYKSALTEHVRGKYERFWKECGERIQAHNTTLCLSVEDVALPTKFGGFSVKWRGDRGDIKEGEDAEIAIKQCRLVMAQNRRRRVKPVNKRSRSAEGR
ncbi:hypothetical protein IW261DRAFT_1419002 [Armillaria novae-zelandiae]|uniref:Uncharacterized protein n=1 Tax=Armillaria novae-zelandiae TaxID=153914 RepID=A0AA39UBP4_9AGAR|nr:hypothetical protein IW261DRAFT_1419002 [Armillaria novae-zelandiae]